jgi:hypothetical protein
VAAGLLAGCAAPTPGPLVIANRSDAILTVGPGLIIEACGSTTTTIAGYEAARSRGQELVVDDQTWDAPEGALLWTFDALTTSGDAPAGAFTFIVSGSADPDMRIGTVAEDALPACGGQPQGIQPGTPLGREQDEGPFDDTYAPTPRP